MARPSLPPVLMFGLAALASLDAGLGLAAWNSIARPPAYQVSAAPEWRLPVIDVVDEPRSVPNPGFPQTLERPLFFKGRRPLKEAAAAPVPAAPAPAQAAVPDPAFSLTGVVIIGRARRAFLTSRAQPLGMWVTQNGEIEGWTVAEVGPQSATLTSGPRRLDLQLYRDHP